MNRSLFATIIASQYHAALRMLSSAIDQCPAELWTQPVGQFPFWLVAYHSLFYTDLYLSQNEESFQPRPFHRQDENFMGKRPFPPYEPVQIGPPHPQARVAEYAAYCQRRAAEAVESETEESLAAGAGFYWLPFTRAELHLYNIRHIQHHAGQLSLALNRATGQGIAWVGMRQAD